MKVKSIYKRPFMSVDSFSPNEYISGCEFKWKYVGSAVPGAYVCEGSFNRNDDFWWAIGMSWQGGDAMHTNIWTTDEAATFLTNDETLPDKLGNKPNYSGNQGQFHLGLVILSWYEFDVQDREVFKYHNAADGKDYYSADEFEKKRNYS